MDRDKDKQIEPVCRFGPGGDFVSVWPGEAVRSPGLWLSSFSKLTGSIAERITALFGSGLNTTTAVPIAPFSVATVVSTPGYLRAENTWRVLIDLIIEPLFIYLISSRTH